MAWHQTGVKRYPKALNLLNTNERFSPKRIAEMCAVSERSVYRWHADGYLNRHIEGNTVLFSIREEVKPKALAAQDNVKRKYMDYELEEFYEQVMKGEREVKIDIGELCRKNADAGTYAQALGALDEFREFVAYLIKR